MNKEANDWWDRNKGTLEHIGGGALLGGAGLGTAAFLNSDKNESPEERKKRVINNSLVGAGLGGTVGGLYDIFSGGGLNVASGDPPVVPSIRGGEPTKSMYQSLLGGAKSLVGDNWKDALDGENSVGATTALPLLVGSGYAAKRAVGTAFRNRMANTPGLGATATKELQSTIAKGFRTAEDYAKSTAQSAADLAKQYNSAVASSGDTSSLKTMYEKAVSSAHEAATTAAKAKSEVYAAKQALSTAFRNRMANTPVTPGLGADAIKELESTIAKGFRTAEDYAKSTAQSAADLAKRYNSAVASGADTSSLKTMFEKAVSSAHEAATTAAKAKSEVYGAVSDRIKTLTGGKTHMPYKLHQALDTIGVNNLTDEHLVDIMKNVGIEQKTIAKVVNNRGSSVAKWTELLAGSNPESKLKWLGKVRNPALMAAAMFGAAPAFDKIVDGLETTRQSMSDRMYAAGVHNRK